MNITIALEVRLKDKVWLNVEMLTEETSCVIIADVSLHDKSKREDLLMKGLTARDDN